MTETPKYKVLKKEDKIELRLYPEYIKAEVQIEDSSYREAIFKGFRILADYIFGNNLSNQSIDMTSPVQVTDGEKIAMTKPVTVQGENGHSVAFIMPSKYSMGALPKPANPAISFTKVDSTTMAAIQFSGFYREGQVKKAEKRLKAWLEKENIELKGPFIAAGYNPPWVPSFLARNEVMVPVSGSN
jgi:effector-binding domain-containing protein